MDNISLEEQLIKYGYFSENIPPCFNSESLFRNYPFLKTSAKNSFSEPLTLTIAKNDDFRRTIKIPNPEQQLKLFDYIISNKEEIEQILSTNTHTLSNPIKNTIVSYDEMHFFDIPILKDKYKIKSNYIESLAKKLKESMGYRYIFKLDLANFYDSIYTHTIEWAIIGKNEAKENNRNKSYKNNMGEKLDFLVRNTNNKETSGIPTGPFSSRIISELLLNKVDIELEHLRKKEKVDYQFVHFVDDYEFYFRNEVDFKNTKHKIRNVFDKYRLKINENKTEFTSYPYHNNKDLKDEFKYLINKYKKSENSQDARLIFFKADELIKMGEKGAYKYLYKLLEKQDLSNVWIEIEPFLIGHLLIKPSLAQYIIKLILNHKKLVSIELIKELKVNLQDSLENSLDNECQWLFWILSELNIEFSVNELVILLSESHDDIFSTMLINYIYRKKKFSSKKIIPIFENKLTSLESQDLRSERWLLIYEWYFNKWYGFEKLEKKINENTFFKAIYNRKVNFFHSK
jgi:hypothetical protein